MEGLQLKPSSAVFPWLLPDVGDYQKLLGLVVSFSIRNRRLPTGQQLYETFGGTTGFILRSRLRLLPTRIVRK